MPVPRGCRLLSFPEACLPTMLPFWLLSAPPHFSCLKSFRRLTLMPSAGDAVDALFSTAPADILGPYFSRLRRRRQWSRVSTIARHRQSARGRPGGGGIGAQQLRAMRGRGFSCRGQLCCALSRLGDAPPAASPSPRASCRELPHECSPAASLEISPRMLTRDRSTAVASQSACPAAVLPEERGS